MTNPDHDPLLSGLAALATDAPAGLLDRVAARWVRVPGPIGELCVAFTDHGIAYVRPSAADPDTRPTPDAEGADGGTAAFAASFRRRFRRPLLPADEPPEGLVTALTSGSTEGLRFDLRELTGFQRDVLHAARAIPPGELRPYGWIARRIGRPKAVRAVGSALGTNPVPLLIPCHRVTRSDGAIGDYVFGARAKETLLRREHVDLDELRALAGRSVVLVGDARTGVVCFPTCRVARAVDPTQQRGFRTLARAEAAGYRPCPRCAPGGGASANG